MAEERAPRRASAFCVGVDRKRCGRKLRRDSIGGRCERCRALLAADDVVNAKRAREHLERLSAAGVGYKTVADASDVGKTTLFEILTGRKSVVRKSTLARILAVDADAIADAALVDAGPTWARIDELLSIGFTEEVLAHRLGFRTRKLQFRRQRVLARTELRVLRLFEALIREHEERERIVRESCRCASPLVLERDGGVCCARCERWIV